MSCQLEQYSWLFKYLLDIIHEAVIVTDLEENIIYVNQSFQEMYGWDRSEIIGKKPSILNAELESDKIQKEILLTVSGGEQFQRTVLNRKKSGEIFLVSISIFPLLSPEKNIIGYVGIQKDITTEKKSEDNNSLAIDILSLLNEKQTEKDNVIREIVKTIKGYTHFDAVAIRLKEGNDFPYYVSDGFPDNFVKQESPLIRIDSDGNETLDCICGLVLNKKGNSETKFFTEGGSFWVNNKESLLNNNVLLPISDIRYMCSMCGYESVCLIPLKSGDEIIGLMQLNSMKKNQFSMDFVRFLEGLGESIGIALARKEQFNKILLSEKTLREATDELKDKNNELEQFAYITSHDLQEPLRVVSNYCQLIKKKLEEMKLCESNDEINRYIGFTISATQRMRSLIRDLLEFSRVGRTDKPFEKIDLKDIIEEVMDGFLLQIDETGAEISIKKGQLPEIFGIRVRILQLFHNLISNAIKFRKDNIPPKIEIGFFDDSSFWTFFIKDNGIGIEYKYQDRIFGVFKRLYSREKYPGTGIGLAMCKRIVETHGGRIWVDSEWEKGSCFYFTLPKHLEVLEF